MFKALKNFLGLGEVKKQTQGYGALELNTGVMGYPPEPTGIPVVNPQVLLSKMNDDIMFIKNELGLSYDDFDRYILPVMINFIEYADLLPASKYKHHEAMGGLVYHSFDCAKRAMRAAEHTQYPFIGTTVDTQQSLKEWKAGTVLSALLHDGGKILADMVVSNGEEEKDKKKVWDAHGNMTINQWARENNITHYFVSWNQRRHLKHKNASLMVMQRLIPQETWSWLDKSPDGKEIHSAMLASVAGGIEHPMSNIVLESDSDSVREDMFNRSTHVSREKHQVPLSELLADLMRHRILIKSWKINQKNAQVWFIKNSLYIAWNSGAADLIDELINTSYVIPTAPDALARIMIEEGMAIANGDELYHEIYPEILGDKSKPIRLNCLKIRNIGRLIVDIDKLYPIGEHDIKPSEPESNPVAKEKPKKEEPKEDLLDDDFEYMEDEAEEVAEQPQLESSIATLSRVLNLVKKSETNKEDRPARKETGDREMGGQPAEEPGTESPGVEQKKPTSVQSEQEQDELFKTDIARFIHTQFDFEVTNGKISVPSERYDDVCDLVVKHKVSGATEFTVNMMIKKSQEVEIDE